MTRLTRKTNGRDYYSYCIYIEKTNELFGRDEKTLEPEEYYKEEPYKVEDSYYDENVLIKLGRIEDLMEEYSLKSVEDLENLLASKVIAGGIRNSGKSIVAKGILYNQLSEELGCPLEVVFKAIDKGIKTTEHYDIGSGQTFKEYIKVEEPHLTFTSIEQDWLKDMDFFKDYANKWCFYFKDFLYLEDKANDEYECLVKLSDYQKTWWLKGEKVNND